MMAFNDTYRIQTPVLSRGSISMKQRQGLLTNVKTIVFNKINLNIPNEVAAQEIVENGLIVNVHCKQPAVAPNGTRRPLFTPICKTAIISVTNEEAMMLIHVLTLRKHFLTVDLSNTQLFHMSDLWERLELADKSHKKLFLVLTDAVSPKFEKKERAINRKKRGMKISGVTLTWFGLFPISIPLIVAGHKTSRCSKFHHTWHDIFNASSQALDVTPIRLNY